MRLLRDVFNGWNGYQTSIVHAIKPLTREQLTWTPSDKVRAIGEIARHIALGRVDWFVRMDAPGSKELAARIQDWALDSDGNRYVVEKALDIAADRAALIDSLNASWEMIECTLNTWTVEDLSVTYRHVWRGDEYEISRQ